MELTQELKLTQEQIEDIQNMDGVGYARGAIEDWSRRRTDYDLGYARATIATLAYLGAINNRQAVELTNQINHLI